MICFVICLQGFKVEDQFYATQIPLKKTIKDFWQLVHERSGRVIVQFGESNDNVSQKETAQRAQ